MKLKIKEKTNEIEVLKEMVKGSTNSLKAKDIDNQRMNKRIQRLEKLIEVNRNFDGGHRNDFMIPERNQQFEETGGISSIGT